jgi:hypothetical protein
VTAFVDGDVVATTECHEVVEVGGAAVFPRVEMVNVAPAHGGAVSGILAVLVA